MKFKSFIASCILTLPLAVSQSGSAAAQATCPCFSTVEVNQITCRGSIRVEAGKYPSVPAFGEIAMFCDLSKLPPAELHQLIKNDRFNYYIDVAYNSADQRYATAIYSGFLSCRRPEDGYKKINAQQWQSCNQLLIDVSK